MTPENRTGRVLWSAFAGLLLTSLALGTIGFAHLTRPPSAGAPAGAQPRRYTTTDIGYYDAQLYVLGAEPFQNGGPYPVALEVARFLAPVAAANGVVASAWDFLAGRRRRRRIRRLRDHAVVCGDDYFALALARRIRDAGVPVVLVTEDSTPSESDLLAIHADPQQLAVLRQAKVAEASTVYACLSDNAANSAVVAASHALLEAKPRAATQQPLSVYARVTDPEFALALRAARLANMSVPRFRLDFFTPHQIAARKLAATVLTEHLEANQPVPAIALVEPGDMGRALLVELARLWRVRTSGPRLPLVVLDRHATALVAQVAGRHPVVGRSCDVHTQDGPVVAREPASILADIDGGAVSARRRIVIYCDLDEEPAFHMALRWARGSAVPHESIVCVQEKTAFGDFLATQVLDAGQIRTFASIDEAAEPDDVRDDTLGRLAQAIHTAYLIVEQAKGRILGGGDPAMEPWHDLSEDLRSANYDQAEAIGLKLAMIGATIVPATDPPLAFAFTDAEVARLAPLEHERWQQERRSRGWTYGPVRDDELLHHPLLLHTWDQLSAGERAKDEAAVLNIPRLLADHDLQIRRRA